MVIRGVIRPPPDIRAVVDKTALFVSKNGRAFESRILNSDKGKTTKFAFLHGTSPFHAYYEERIRFYEGGGKDGDDDADAGDGGDKDGTGGKKEEGGDEDATKEEEKARAEGGDEGAVGGDEKTATAGGAAVAPPAATGAGGGGGSSSKTRKATVDPVSRALLAERAELQRATAPPPPPPEKDDAKEGESEDADAAASPPTPAPAPAPVPLSSLAPPSLPFASMAAPSNATPAQLDVMRLTAQFACLTRVASDKKFASQSGGTFFDELKLREWNNPTFAFLQPRHGHFAYFTALVDGYRRILHLATATGKGEAGGGDLEAAVAGMMKRTELDDLRKSREEREACRRRRSGAEVRRGGLGASVGGGDGAGLGGCLRAAARRAEYDRLRREEEERKRSEAEGGGAAASDALGGVAAVDWHDFVVVETIDFAVDEEVQAPPPPPPPPPRKPSAVPRGKEEVVGGGTDAKPAEEEEDDEDMDMDTDDDDEEEEKIEIVSDYAPKIVSHASAAEDLTRTHMIDPITGKSVALADMSEHMRIQLLDPKWAEEKKRFMEKQKESNFVRGTDIAKNISRFAKQRGDIFGSSEAELLNQEEDSRKRLEEANRIIREQASLPQPQHQPQRESTAAAGNKRPSEPGYPRAPTGSSPRPEANASPPAKKPRPMTSAPSMPPPPPPLATFPAAPPPPATRSPPPPPPAASKPPPESSDAGFAQQSSVPPPPPPPPPPSAQQQPAKMSPPKPTPASDSDAPGSKAAPPAPADEPAEKETPAPPPAPVIPGVVHLSIQVPVAGPDDQQWSQWQFRGQTVSIKVDDAETATIKSIKERLRPTLGNMPLNKMQLKGGGGFLKDGVKLADVVRGPTEKMELVPKVRGGRK